MPLGRIYRPKENAHLIAAIATLLESDLPITGENLREFHYKHYADRSEEALEQQVNRIMLAKDGTVYRGHCAGNQLKRANNHRKMLHAVGIKLEGGPVELTELRIIKGRRHGVRNGSGNTYGCSNLTFELDRPQTILEKLQWLGEDERTHHRALDKWKRRQIVCQCLRNYRMWNRDTFTEGEGQTIESSFQDVWHDRDATFQG